MLHWSYTIVNGHASVTLIRVYWPIIMPPNSGLRLALWFGRLPVPASYSSDLWYTQCFAVLWKYDRAEVFHPFIPPLCLILPFSREQWVYVDDKKQNKTHRDELTGSATYGADNIYRGNLRMAKPAKVAYHRTHTILVTNASPIYFTSVLGSLFLNSHNNVVAHSVSDIAPKALHKSSYVQVFLTFHSFGIDSPVLTNITLSTTP